MGAVAEGARRVVVAGPVVTLSKSRLSGCEAGHADLESSLGVLSGPCRLVVWV